MRRAVLCVLTLLLVCGLTYAAQAAERRVALVIGNAVYRHTDRLNNPVNDARRIATALRSVGFEVITGENLDLRRMYELVGRFERALGGAQVALVYYSGHGMAVDGINYLLPVDAKLASRSALRAEAVAINWLLEDVVEAPDRVSIIVFDACRTNPIARSFAARTRSTVGAGLVELQAKTGAYIAFATAPGAVAADGAGENSPFTAALLRHIATPGLTIDGLMTKVRREVWTETGQDQRPWASSALLGEFYFVPPTEKVPPPAQQAALPPAPPRPQVEAPKPPPAEAQPNEANARDVILGSGVLIFDKPQLSANKVEEFKKGEILTIKDYNNKWHRVLKPVLGYINSNVVLENYQRHTATPTNLAFVQGRDGPVQDGVEAARGLSRGDWRKLQQSLSALGFDTRGTDGKPGQNTRKAIAAWQSGKRQEATGYLTKLQRDVILSEAQPKLAALPKVLPPPQVAQVNPALVMAIRNQVMPCWSTPIGIQGVAGLRTELNIVLGPDGSVRSVQPVDTGRMSTDGVFRTFTESAVRTVYACSPLKLPPESYQVWRNIIFNFDLSLRTDGLVQDKASAQNKLGLMSSSDAETGYDSSMKLLQAGLWSEAEKAFKNFLETSPSDSRASSAAYWLAETHYFRKHYRKAADAFARNYRTYGPEAPRAPDNLLKLGMSLRALGDREKACQTYGELAYRHPNAPMPVRATLTRERSAAECA